jgi:outer membrane protein OmpA-like peptidoglycan-associated protein
MFPLNPFIKVELNKEFDPIFGAGVEGTFWMGSNDKQRFGVGHTLVSNRFDTMNGHNFFRGVQVGFNGTVNLTNLICGYNEGRVATTSIKAGMGYGRTKVPSSSGKERNDLTTTTSIVENFRVSDASSIKLEGGLFWSLYHSGQKGIKFNKNNAQLFVSVGYVYHFKNSNGTRRFKEYNVNKLEREIARLRVENERKPKIVEKTTIVNVPSNVSLFNNSIPFAKGKADLTDETVKKLDEMAKVLKGKTVDVEGYASYDNPANEQFDLELSKQRAVNVAEYLQQKGVTVRKTSYFGHGMGEESQREVKIILLK